MTSQGGRDGTENPCGSGRGSGPVAGLGIAFASERDPGKETDQAPAGDGDGTAG